MKHITFHAVSLRISSQLRQMGLTVAQRDGLARRLRQLKLPTQQTQQQAEATFAALPADLQPYCEVSKYGVFR